MRKKQEKKRMSELVIDLITTILLVFAVITLIVVASISIKNMNKQNEILSKSDNVEIVFMT